MTREFTWRGLRLETQTSAAGRRVAGDHHALPGLDVISAAAICLAGLSLRLHGISEPSLWLDEGASWRQARLDFVDMLRVTSYDNYPPLHNLVLHCVIWFFGDSELALRLPSAIFGTLNILAVYWLGRSLGFRAAGVVAAAILAFSGFHIWYSQEARPYALLALCATLFVGFVLQSLRTGKTSWYAASAAAALALLYTHPYGFLLWVSIGLVVVVYAALPFEPARMRSLKLIAWQIVAGIGFLPWAVILFARSQAIVEKGFWIPYPGPWFIFRTTLGITNGDLMFAIMLPAVLAALFLPTSRIIGGSASLRSDDFSVQDRAILFAWLIGPFALALAVSLTLQPLLLPRYLICSLPAVIILAAIGLSRLMVNRALTAATFTLASLYAIYSMMTNGQQVREDWRGAAATISKSFQPGDCLAIYKDNGLRPFTYYFRDPIPCLVSVTQVSDFGPAEIRSSRVWLVLDGVNNAVSAQDVEAVTGRFAQQGWRGTPVQDKGVVVLVFDRGKP